MKPVGESQQAVGHSGESTDLLFDTATIRGSAAAGGGSFLVGIKATDTLMDDIEVRHVDTAFEVGGRGITAK